MKLIAKSIKEARIKKGLTQEELAIKAKVNLRTVQRIENSENIPRNKTLSLICEVLHLNTEKLLINSKNSNPYRYVSKIIYTIFLLFLNLILISIIGFLTFDSEANPNSVFGGFLLSIFIPLFIVSLSKNISGEERLLKFGFGYIFYFFFILIKVDFASGFSSGLFPCLLISLVILFFGNRISNCKNNVL